MPICRDAVACAFTAANLLTLVFLVALGIWAWESLPDQFNDRLLFRSASPDGGLVVETVLRDGAGFGLGWQAGLVRVRPTDPRRRGGWTTVARFAPEGLDVLAAPDWTDAGELRLRFSRPVALVEGPIDADGRPTLVCIRRPAPSDDDDCRSSQIARPDPAATSASPTASTPSATR